MIPDLVKPAYILTVPFAPVFQRLFLCVEYIVPVQIVFVDSLFFPGEVKQLGIDISFVRTDALLGVWPVVEPVGF